MCFPPPTQAKRTACGRLGFHGFCYLHGITIKEMFTTFKHNAHTALESFIIFIHQHVSLLQHFSSRQTIVNKPTAAYGFRPLLGASLRLAKCLAHPPKGSHKLCDLAGWVTLGYILPLNLCWSWGRALCFQERSPELIKARVPWVLTGLANFDGAQHQICLFI